MMHIKRIILRSKLFLSTLFARKLSQKEDIIYQLNDPEFKKLPKKNKQNRFNWIGKDLWKRIDYKYVERI